MKDMCLKKMNKSLLITLIPPSVDSHEEILPLSHKLPLATFLIRKLPMEFFFDFIVQTLTNQSMIN